MIREDRRARLARPPPAPLVPHRREPRQQAGIEEGLVDAKAVVAVGRVPGVGGLAAAEMTEGITPAGALERVDPSPLALVEARDLLVDNGPAGVRVAEEQGGAVPPALRHREDGVEKVPLPAGDAVGNVHGPERERTGRGHRREKPAPGLARRVTLPEAAERPARGHEEAIRACRGGI